jgi:hypothetical protein
MATLDGILLAVQNAVIAINNLAQVTSQSRTGVLMPVSTVSGLPSASAYQGSARFVTDSTQTIIAGLGTTVVGGGTYKVPVYSDGANWIIG